MPPTRSQNRLTDPLFPLWLSFVVVLVAIVSALVWYGRRPRSSTIAITAAIFAPIDHVGFNYGAVPNDVLADINFGRLSKLGFVGSRLDDKVMARLGKLDHLRDLDLTDTGLTDRHLSRLANVAHFDLLILNSNNKISDEGVECLPINLTALL
jgi:hypothetical protein